jgi:hypothetical protein
MLNYLGRFALHGTKLVGRVGAILAGVAAATVWEAVKAGQPCTASVEPDDANEAVPTREFPAMHSGGYQAVGDEYGPF